MPRDKEQAKERAAFYGDDRVIKNPQHENFAVWLARGVQPAEAYRRAFNLEPDTKVGSRPSSLRKRSPEIDYRVTQILKANSRIAQQQTAVDFSFIQQKQLEVLEVCMTEETWDAAGANKSIDQLAKLGGHYQSSKKNESDATKDIDELRSELAELEREEGSRDRGAQARDPSRNLDS